MTLDHLIYLISLFWSGAACFIFGIYDHYRTRTRPAFAYLHLCFTLGLLSISYCVTISVSFYPVSLASHYLTLLGLFLFFPIFLHFALIFTGREARWSAVIYLPPAISFLWLLTSYQIEVQPLAVGYFFPLGRIAPLYTLLYLCYISIGLFLIWRTNGNSAKSYERLQARIIILASIIPITLGPLIDQALVHLGKPHIIFSPHLAVFSMALIGYALFRYSPIRQLKKGQVAESAAAAIPQALFLTNTQERISFVNQAALKLLDRRAHQVLGHELTGFISAVREGLTEIKPLHGVRPVYIELKVTPLPDGQGQIYLARDLSPVRAAQQEIKKLNEDLRKSLAKENDLEKWISVLAGLIDEEEIKAAWQKLKAEKPELIVALQPVYKNVLEQAEVMQEAGQAQKQLNKKIEEVNWLSHFMTGREELLKELQTELKELSL